MRITVTRIVGLRASGEGRERILQAYPTVDPEDIDAALTDATWPPLAWNIHLICGVRRASPTKMVRYVRSEDPREMTL